MTIPHFQLLNLIYNQPQAVRPEMLDMAEVWAARTLQMNLVSVQAAEAGWPYQRTARDDDPQVAAGPVSGVQTVPIHGVLLPRSIHLDPCTTATDYETLRRQIHAAVRDPQIEHIVLDIDSPGGAVAGCFELAEDIRDWSRHTPITAVVNYSAYSAAYALASAASEVVVAPSSGVGSIGIIARHADFSARNSQEGIKVTSIFAGARKNDLSPHAPLSEAAAQRLQQHVDQAYRQFVETVAIHRGLSMEEVRDTEADVYHGAEAVSLGLADRVETPQAAINRIAADVAERHRNRLAGQPPGPPRTHVSMRARAMGLAMEL